MKLKTFLSIILIVIFLVSCAPRTAATATPTPTITPTTIPTATTALTIQVGDVQVPDPRSSNPELFDLNNADSPIVQFAKAFKISPADVHLQNPQLLTSRDGNKFIFLTTLDLPYTKDIDETGIPLFIAVKNDKGEWIWSGSSLKEMCSINGLKCGSTFSGDENYQDPAYNALILKEFNIIDSAGTTPVGVNRDGFQFEDTYSQLAQQYGISFRTGHLFDWGDDVYPVSLESATKDEIGKWMNKWVEQTINGYPFFDSINFANEPVGIYDGSQYWVTDCGNPWYRAYGEQWPVEAYSMIYNQLVAKGLKPGEDVHLLLNLPYGAKEWGYNPQFTIDFMAQMKREIQARVGQNAVMDIGIELYLRDVPQSQVDWGGPNIEDLNQEALTKFFQDLGEIGPVHITELSVKNVQNPATAMNGINMVISSAIQSGAVKDIIFWEALKENNFMFNSQFQNNIDFYLVLQTLLANLGK